MQNKLGYKCILRKQHVQYDNKTLSRVQTFKINQQWFENILISLNNHVMTAI